MEINKQLVDRLLRTAITMSVFAFFLMVILAVFGGGHWSMWVPPLIACAGVVISFGVYVNKLHGRFGMTQTTPEAQEANRHSTQTSPSA